MLPLFLSAHPSSNRRKRRGRRGSCPGDNRPAGRQRRLRAGPGLPQRSGAAGGAGGRGRGRGRGAGPAAHSRSAARSHSRISNFFTDGSPICSFRLRCARREEEEEEEEDKAVDAMGQLCCFPFSRGEDKISKWQRCGLPPPRGAQSCGRAGLGVLLPLGTFTDCFLEKGQG